MTPLHAARGFEKFQKKPMKKIITMVMFFCLCSLAQAHSGGTDSEGCHNDRKAGTRHCH